MQYSKRISKVREKGDSLDPKYKVPNILVSYVDFLSFTLFLKLKFSLYNPNFLPLKFVKLACLEVAFLKIGYRTSQLIELLVLYIKFGRHCDVIDTSYATTGTP